MLANCYGNIREIFDTDVPEGTLTPSGYSDIGSLRTTPIIMRREILERLGDNKVIVGFHVCWILTAVKLVLPASRVVNLGTEKCFQKFCRDLADGRPKWKVVLIEHLAVSYDPRWPAVVLREHLEL